jgi:hypothetical protein
MAKENRSWGYDRIAGALVHLGYDISGDRLRIAVFGGIEVDNSTTLKQVRAS